MFSFSLKKLSFLALFLTLPFLPSTPYLGFPLWAWASIGMSLIYGLILIIRIEKEFKVDNDA